MSDIELEVDVWLEEGVIYERAGRTLCVVFAAEYDLWVMEVKNWPPGSDDYIRHGHNEKSSRPREARAVPIPDAKYRPT